MPEPTPKNEPSSIIPPEMQEYCDIFLENLKARSEADKTNKYLQKTIKLYE